jgi:hypothetical protein
MAATNTQVQHWSDERTRVRAEQIRALFNALTDDLAAIEDVYQNLTDSPDWADTRTDGPPNLLGPNDLLAIHGFIFDIKAAMAGHASLPVVMQACVRPVG